jgi:hypothetical protein
MPTAENQVLIDKMVAFPQIANRIFQTWTSTISIRKETTGFFQTNQGHDKYIYIVLHII